MDKVANRDPKENGDDNKGDHQFQEFLVPTCFPIRSACRTPFSPDRKNFAALSTFSAALHVHTIADRNGQVVR
jgi:hypothetical protein